MKMPLAANFGKSENAVLYGIARAPKSFQGPLWGSRDPERLPSACKALLKGTQGSHWPPNACQALSKGSKELPRAGRLQSAFQGLARAP